MNRELRRLQEREERRQKKEGKRTPAVQQRAEKRERTGIRQFLREVREELGKVQWPTRQTLITYTIVSLITTLAVTAYVSALDFGFNALILRLLLGQ